MRVSIGPAIRVSDRGWQGWSSSAISAAAASACTQGWHTATTCAPGPMARRNQIRCSTYSSKPKRPCQMPTSRALAQSVMCTSCSGSSTRTVSRSRVAKWPLSGATSSTLGCGRHAFLGEAQERAERRGEDLLLAHRHHAVADLRSRSMPKEGRRWVSVARLIISQRAPAARQLSRSPPPDRPCPAAVAQTRIGSIMSAAVWYSE